MNESMDGNNNDRITIIIINFGDYHQHQHCLLVIFKRWSLKKRNETTQVYIFGESKKQEKKNYFVASGHLGIYFNEYRFHSKKNLTN